MANLPESNTYEANIYQIEATDPVQGGADGVSNTQAKQLANRTKYLKDQVDKIKTGQVDVVGRLVAGTTVPTAVAGDNSTKPASTAFVNSAIAAGSIGRKNAIINGDFTINQRIKEEIDVTANQTKYTLDRWLVKVVGARSVKVKQTTDLRAAKGCAKSVLLDVSAAGAGSYSIRQRIESVLTFEGENVVLSFLVKSTINQTLTMRLAQFPTRARINTDTPYWSESKTADVEANVISQVTATFSIQQWGDLAQADDEGSCLELAIYPGGAGAHAVYIGNVQLEAGVVATPFERLPIATQLADCLRYFEQLAPDALATDEVYSSFSSNDAALDLYLTWPFKARKRIVPTMAMQAGTYAGVPSGINSDGVRIYRKGRVAIYAQSTADAEI